MLRKKLALILAPLALIVGLAACDTDSVGYHCGLVIQQRLIPYGHGGDGLYRQSRSGNWDFCDFRGSDGHEHHFYIQIHTHEIQGG